MGKKDLTEPPKNNKKIIWLLLSVILILIIANAITAYFWQRVKLSTSDVNQNNNRLSLLNPAREFFHQEDLIINFQPLRDYLNNTYSNDSNISIYFEYLHTGANISLNKDAEFYPASLLKVPVAMAVAKKIERGEWKWSNELVLMSTDKDDKFGTLYKEPTNSTHTIEDLVRRSLSESDNSAHFMLVRNLEIEEMKGVYDHMGLEGFLETEGNLSAKRYSLLFRTLYASSYITEENSQKLLSYLSLSPFNNYIQSGLPENIVFAHKIGVDEDKKVYLDSGIAYVQNRPYMLTVMTKNKDEQKALEIMKNVSEKVYNYISSYNEE